MGTTRQGSDRYATPLRRLLVGVTVVALLGLFVLWRIDSPRVERMRAALVDATVPNMDWALVPVTRALSMIEGFRSYSRIYAQNQELKRELQTMKAWKEAALQLEQKNARLLDLNQVRLDPKLTHVTGVVLADAGSPFRQSVLLNVGAHDGIRDGWVTMDGIGLVGRISGVGERTSRVILATDTSSRIPVTVQPSGQRALLSGDNSPLPLLDFVGNADLLRPGDRVVTSGDGGVLPAGLLVGQVVLGSDRRLRVALAADYQRLEFLRVLRSHEIETIADPGNLLVPEGLRPEADGNGGDSDMVATERPASLAPPPAPEDRRAGVDDAAAGDADGLAGTDDAAGDADGLAGADDAAGDAAGAGVE